MAYPTATFQAVSVLLFIHFKSEGGCVDYLSAKKLSEMLNIPAPTVVKVLNRLNAAGLITTKEGAKGGTLLARPISEITFLDVFNAMEHGKQLFKVHTEFNFEYEYLDRIKEKAMRCLTDAEDSMRSSLDKVTLLDLLE
ncbi:MAG: Rrf2 family transcriptional regulator [Methanomassiliicoccaceae archaeon]|jgi:Rrf2 family protein|nr:Rrf2 family transcriptional regulator [Methanomassiliicoccaceae archaeon]